MRDGSLAPLGGSGKIVEIDETAQGKVAGAPKRVRRAMGGYGRTVFTLVERGGAARSFHVEGTTLAQLMPIIRANVHRESAVMTDAASWYKFLPAYVATTRLSIATKNMFATKATACLPQSRPRARRGRERGTV
jgi:ISXO2-like transposase domain